MVRRLAAVAVLTAVGLALPARSGAADDPPKKDPTAELLAKLRGPCPDAGDEVKLRELAARLSGEPGVPVLVNAPAFKAGGKENPGELMVRFPPVKGMSLGAALRHALGQHSATFLVRRGYLEIVPVAGPAKEAKGEAAEDDAARADLPLVSVIFREKPLNEAVAELADEYGLTVVVAPQTGDNKTGFVNGRLLNVPADKALELLAVQADLRVVRKGPAFLITGKDHANELFGERLDQDRQKAEVERLRITPPVPQPMMPPAPAPGTPPPPPAPTPVEKK